VSYSIVLVQFETIRRRRSLILAQGWSTATTLGIDPIPVL
jgi:hypothetical protein